MVQSSALSVDKVINNIPPEVWRGIFGFSNLKSHGESCGEEDCDVVQLSHVCRLWRNVINNSPELWTHVDVHAHITPALSRPVVRPGIEMLSLILRNARDMPLAMSLKIKGFSTDTTSLIGDVCKLFFRAARRAEHLQLRIYGHIPLQEIATEIRPALKLQSLGICIRTYYNASIDSVVSGLSKLWNPAPLLRTLTLPRIGNTVIHFPLENARSLEAATFPFQQLTALCVEFWIDLDVICYLMSCMPSLITVTLDTVLMAEEQLIEDLEGPSLRELTLHGCLCGYGPPSSMQLLDFALARSPSLTTLRLTRLHECEDASLQHFASVLKKSSPCIEHLQFDFIPSTDDEKIECLKLLPALRTLDLTVNDDRFTESVIGTTFCEAMQEWDSSARAFMLCPRLEKLAIDHRTLQGPASQSFAEMVEERWRRSLAAGRTFQVIIENVEEGLENYEMLDDIMHIQALKKFGLKATITPKDWVKRYFQRLS